MNAMEIFKEEESIQMKGYIEGDRKVWGQLGGNGMIEGEE